MYLLIRGAVASATIPPTPVPSSRAVDDLSRMPDVKSGFWGQAIHSAIRGLSFQTTAPVVPVGLDEDRREGD